MPHVLGAPRDLTFGGELLDEAVDLTGDEAAEAADGFPAARAVGGAPVEVVADTFVYKYLSPRKRVIAMQVKRQQIVDVLRAEGLTELADEVRRTLPEVIDMDRAADFLQRRGVTKDSLVSRMGGSP